MILPGNMSLGLLSKLVTDWIGVEGGAWLTRMSTTYRVPVQPDHTLTIQRIHHHIRLPQNAPPKSTSGWRTRKPSAW